MNLNVKVEDLGSEIVNIPLQISEVEMILGEIASIESQTDIGHGLSNLKNMLRAAIGIGLLTTKEAEKV